MKNNKLMTAPREGTKNLVRLLAVFLMFFAFKAEAQNNALNFDGVNDYVMVANSTTTNFTIEAWIKSSVSSHSGSYAYQGSPLAWSDVGGGANDFTFSILNNHLAFFDGSNTGEIEGTIDLCDGNWHHVAIARTAGGTSYLYVDGAQDGSGTAGPSILTDNSIIEFGGNTGDGVYFNGNIDELRIWNTAFTQSQIQAAKNTVMAGTETGLINYYNFNQGTANASNNVTTLSDKTANANNGALNNFALTGTASNWVGGNAPVVGTTPIFNPSMAVQPYGNVDSPGNESYLNIIDGNDGSKFLDHNTFDGFGFTVNLGGNYAIANSIAITTANDVSGRDPQNFEVLGSNNGTNFTSIATGGIPCINDRFFTRSFSFSNSNSYKHYRINFTNACGDSMFQLAEVQLYGSVFSSPKPALSPSSCGSTLAALNTDVMANFFAGATDYRFKVVAYGNTDVIERGNKRFFNLTMLPYGATYNTSYTISVSVKKNGVWGDYGTECIVTTPTLPKTQVRAIQCSATLAALNTDIQADWLQFATAYRFKVVDWNGNTEVIERPYRYFNLTALTAGATYNTAYTVSVAVQHNGTWGAYGAECVVTTPQAPTTKVRAAQCGATLAALNTDILADWLQFATAYRFKVMVNGASYIVNPVGNRRFFKLTSLPVAVTAGTMYTISVAAQFNGVWGEYGTSCDVTPPANSPSNLRQTVKNADFSLVAYPNPSNSTFTLQVNGTNDDAVSILVFDMTGRQIENKVVKANDIENISLGQNYSTGIYNVVVSQGMNTKTVRLVKN